MRIKIVNQKQKKLVLGSSLKHGDLIELDHDLLMVIWDKERYCGQYTSYGTIWCINLQSYELTYIDEQQYYHLYKQVSPLEVEELYE